MNNKKIILTKDGYDQLVNELKMLKEEQIPQVLEQLQLARSMGDLSENGMYTATRDKHSMLLGRQNELEDIIKNASIADSASTGDNATISVGSKVKLESSKVTVSYHIVGIEEVNINEGKISHESPIGKELIGKKVGDSIEFNAPVGKIKYKIVEVN